MKRTSHATTLLIAIASAAAVFISPAKLLAQPPRLNVVLILADDLGGVDLGCYGADLHETPNLDRLAKQGLRFTNAYASAPICSPTRAAIMTGKHPARLHMTIWREATLRQMRDRALIPPNARSDLPHEERTLAEALSEAGYLTAHIGKWHLGDASGFPEAHGFDTNIGGNHWGAPATHFFPYRGQGHGELRYVPGLAGGQPGEYLADRLTDEAIDIIRGAGDRPFFVNLWHYGVHTPVEAKPADIERSAAQLTSDMHHQNIKYAAMVKNLDDNVGRLLAAVEKAGIADRTVILFASDNGGYINAWTGELSKPVTNNHPLRSGKGSLYEGGVRVPMIAYWPGVTPKGETCDEPVVSADLYRTIQEIAGIEPQLDAAQQADGASLAGLFKDPKSKLERDALYWHYPHYYPTNTPSSSIRRGNWKLIHYYEGPRTELYDLAADPSESRDLAKSETGRAEELQADLNSWLKRVDAQMATVNPEARSR